MSKATATSKRKLTASDKAHNERIAKAQAEREQKAKARKERLRKLINACLEHFGEEEIVEAFSEIVDTKYVTEHDVDKSISELTMLGYAIFKTESIWEADKLKEYAQVNVFPYYNMQQEAILF